MFGIGMPEMLLILAVALIIIGPKKLPDLAKTLGKALGDFKRATSDLKESIEMETGLDEVRDNLSAVKDNLKESIALADEAPAVKPTAARQADAPEQPLARVKDAFDELNAADDSKADAPDDDAAGSQDPHSEDKATP